MLPVRVPVFVGVNVTLMEQLAPAGERGSAIVGFARSLRSRDAGDGKSRRACRCSSYGCAALVVPTVWRGEGEAGRAQSR